MQESTLIQKAKELIASVHGKKLAPQKRSDLTISLATILLEEANRIQTPQEKSHQAQLACMMDDPMGKVFTTAMTDQAFRSKNPSRIADQLTYLMGKYGIPNYLSLDKKIALSAFKLFGKVLSPLTVPLTVHMIRKETATVILPGEEKELAQHMQQRRKEGVRINLNHLGEAILGEEEAQHRLQVYLNDLAKSDVEYISIKISTIFSQINLLAWENTRHVLNERLRHLYRAAMKNKYRHSNGTITPKFVNLDMEEYRDLHLTVDVFQSVLNEPEFFQHSAGIVLQSYLPDAYLIQQKLTEWAMIRFANGGAPIKIRIVKGANLAMEKVEASLRDWPQAPFTTKAEVDANFKRMILFGCEKKHAEAAAIGLASHNLFDIAFGLILRSENEVEKEVSFEMLEGMADHLRRVVQQVSGSMLLYCPAATKDEFQNAVAYLVRRLDENTAPENFLRHAFNLNPHTSTWDEQAHVFVKSCEEADKISFQPRRTQNRLIPPLTESESSIFKNESDTDWSLPQNQEWTHHLLAEWKQKIIEPIPLVIAGTNIYPQHNQIEIGVDPSYPEKPYYKYTLATHEDIDKALSTANQAEKKWSQTSIQERSQLFVQIARELRKNRGKLIGAMVADTGKSVHEADIEVSEAIDFANYYRKNYEEWASLPDIEWEPKGIILVTPPWNFPCSIPCGGILAALITGNCVIFKPASEAVLVGWTLVQICYEAGVDPSVLQFVTCQDEPIGSQLIKDPRVSAVILTGATATAKLFLNMRPDLDLIAETGGKNTLVITDMADRDLAIKDLVQSAFGYSGQKCSACSLAIIEAPVYDDPHFRKQLKDAASSLSVGSPWDPKTRVNPLIQQPSPHLLRGLTQLDEGEEWLLKPQQDLNNPNLWSPGIKLGVKPDSFTFQTELFGPVLGLVRAENVSQAFHFMNQTPYGLTAGIHSLDEREQNTWFQQIVAGNCYINRTITGAIVQRQPFGGCKNSSFGKGAKAGGPNYLTQLMHATQKQLPIEKIELDPNLKNLLEGGGEIWERSLASYQYNYTYYFSKKHDPSVILGQDNFQCYVPHEKITLRLNAQDTTLDVMRCVAACIICKTPIEVSMDPSLIHSYAHLQKQPFIKIILESDTQLIQRIKEGLVLRVRLLQNPDENIQKALAEKPVNIHLGPVLANGRLELLNYLREVSLSRDYHRYGNLGDREKQIV